MNETTNYGLPKPAQHESGPTFASDFNTKMDAADTAIAAAIATASGPVGTIASSATPYPSSDGTNTGTKVNHFTITALAAAAELQTPVGSWSDGDTLTIRIKDNATARALTYVASYRAIGVVLPDTTTISKTLYLRCYYNSAAVKWDVLGVSQEE